MAGNDAGRVLLACFHVHATLRMVSPRGGYGGRRHADIRYSYDQAAALKPSQHMKTFDDMQN